MGFWKNRSSGNRDDSDNGLRDNSKRIQNNEEKMRELQAIRNRIPRRDVEEQIEYDSEIEKCRDELAVLREKREQLHIKNYSHEPEAYTKNLGKLKTAKKILVLFIVCCLAFIAVVILPF